MRLLNSICKVIASYYTELPVHIEEVPNEFKRGCFLVTLATDGSRLKNYNVYQTDPVFQIVYFGKRNEANQVLAEELYRVKEELVAIFDANHGKACAIDDLRHARKGHVLHFRRMQK